MTLLKDYFDLVMPEVVLPDMTGREKIKHAFRIKSTDDIQLRKTMFLLARFFKREFSYDGIQYASYYDIEDDDECHAYMWTLDKGKNHEDIKSFAFGGFCFRKRSANRYGLQWIWLHPYLRNRGLLTKHWSSMKEKFGHDFYVEPPYSLPLEKFLNKKENKHHTFEGGGMKIPYWYGMERSTHDLAFDKTNRK